MISESNESFPERSQTITVLSFDPDAIIDALWLTAIQFTYRECSARVLIQFPCKFHNFNDLSKLADINRVPGVLNLYRIKF